MDYTQHYQLPQWVETDRILMEDFNDAFSAIDGVLGQVPGLGNAAIETGTYLGTGDYDFALHFIRKPFLVVIQEAAGEPHTGFLVYSCPWWFTLQGFDTAKGELMPAVGKVTWGENSLALDAVYTGQQNAMLNGQGRTYRYVALTADA